MIVRRLQLVTPPAEEPLSLDEARRAVRRFDADEDDELEALVTETRDHCEGSTGRQFVTATWDMVLSGIPCEGWIEVPRPPLQSVTSIQYYDVAGTLQTLASTVYGVVAPSGPRAERGRIVLKPDQDWPSHQDRDDAITVRFVAGYGAASAVPPALKRAMKLLLGHWYANREAAVVGVGRQGVITPMPLGVPTILAKFRCRDEQRVA